MFSYRVLPFTFISDGVSGKEETNVFFIFLGWGGEVVIDKMCVFCAAGKHFCSRALFAFGGVM